MKKDMYPVTIGVISIVLLFAGPLGAFAATTPSLGSAATYAVLGSTYTNTSAGTTVNGDVGFTTPPAIAPSGTHINYGSGAPYATAGTDQSIALSALNSQPCTFSFAGGAVNLSTDTTHGAIGVYPPGVYCSSGAMDVGGPLTLSGSGTYIFRPAGALTTTAGAVITLNGASTCDVFWTPSAATTLAANTTFFGTLISNAGITVGANTVWSGRSLAFGGTVTTDTDTITAPTCAGTPPPPPPAAPVCTLSVNPSTMQTGSSSSLLWTTANATSFVLNQGIGSVTPVASGSKSIVPLITTTYTGTATGTKGSITCSATMLVVSPIPSTTVATTSIALVTTATTTTLVTPVLATTTTPVFATTTILTTTTVPSLPNTGFPPRKITPVWDIITLAGILIVGTVIATVVRKRAT